MSDREFVHLHTHSHFSLLRAPCRIDDLVERAVDDGMPALALTDMGNMFGTIEFYKAARDAGIKPIIGCELFVAPDMHEKNPSGSDRENRNLTVLCKNQTGYRNLIKLVTKGYQEGFYYNPRVDFDCLSNHADGLVCLSGNWESELNTSLLVGNMEEARGTARDYKDLFGDDYYIELNRHGREGEDTAIDSAVNIARDLDIPLVATNDVYYMEPDDALAQQVMTCIRTNTKLEQVTQRSLPTDEFYMKRTEQMVELFDDLPEAIDNTVEIAEKCDVELPLDTYHLPVYDEEKDEAEILEQRCRELLPQKYDEVTEEIEERLEHELSVIEDMGFPGYFLIVQELVQEAKDRNIPVGPGRGSAAGCLVSYLLGITGIDPIEHDLIFERFLNPGRHEMPDIDIDFCKDRRDELIEFTREKYGEERVSQIITFGSMKARAVIRDVGRILGISLEEVDEIAKRIPSEVGITLDEAWDQEPKLRRLIENGGNEYQRLWDLSQRLEGVNRNAGKHAAGVVIGDQPLTEYCPLYVSDKGETTQFDGDAVEEAGLLKMDFLGLKNLTQIEHALQMIEEEYGERPDIENEPFDDQATYEMLQDGRATGVFQLESEGMMGLCQRLEPDCFDDVIALLALYRPGPLDSGMADDYVNRKHNPDEISYPHPKLKDILEPTYGVMIYQEQIMQAASKLAGFSLGEADKLRKAMGKKIPELLEKYRKKFVEGAVERDVERETAADLFDKIEKFGRYGFNRSHSAASAMITMQTAYLKANYPVPYMSALLTSAQNNTDKLAEYIDETRDMGIEVLPPDINESEVYFSVAGDQKIRYGLAAVKQVGEKAARDIVETRKEGDPYQSVFDLCSRVDLSLVDTGCLEALVSCGSFDSIHEDRANLFKSLDLASEYGSRTQRDRERGQQSLFGQSEQQAMQPDLREGFSWSDEERVAREKDVFGYYLNSSPLTRHESIVRSLRTRTIPEVVDQVPDAPVRIGGMVTYTRELRIKNGQHAGEMMLVFRVKGIDGDEIECVLFSEGLEEYGHRVFEDSVVLVEGTVRQRDESVSFTAERVELAERAVRFFVEGFEVQLDQVEDQQVQALQSIFTDHRGSAPMYFKVNGRNGGAVRLQASDQWEVNPTEYFLDDLKNVVPEQRISVYPKSVTISGSGENGWN